MSKGKVAYIVLLLLMMTSVIYFIYSYSLNKGGASDGVGAGYFPMLLSVLLFILCTVDIIKTTKNKESKELFQINNLMTLITVIISFGVYFIVWKYIGYFYIITFIYLTFLLLILSPKKIKIRFLLVSILFTLFVYLLFDKLLAISFS